MTSELTRKLSLDAKQRTAQSRRSDQIGVAFALTTAISFGLAGPFSKSLLEVGWSPAGVVAVRSLAASLILAVPVWLATDSTWRTLWTHRRRIGFYGAGPVAGCQLCFVAAVSRLPVSVALLIEYLAPLVIVAYLWARFGHRPGLRTAIGAVVAVTGLVLVLDLVNGFQLSLIGVLWAVGAMVCMVVYFLMNARPEPGLPPLMLSAGGLAFGAVLAAVGGAVGLLPWGMTMSTASVGAMHAPSLVVALALGAASTALPYVGAVGAARRLGARIAAFLAMLEVLTAAAFSWILLDQQLSPLQLAGAALVVAGVLLVQGDA